MRVFLCALICLLLFSVSGHCAQLAESQKELRQIKQRLEETEQQLNKQELAEKELLQDLSQVSTSLKRIDRRLRMLKNEQKRLNAELAAARSAVRDVEQQLNSTRRTFEHRLVALYKEGETGPLQLFFSSKTPMEMIQNRKYLALITAQDQQLLKDFAGKYEQSQARQRKLEDLREQKKALIIKEKDSRSTADQGRKLYSTILQRVRKDKQQYAAELKRLEERASRLEGLLKTLKKKTYKKKAEAAFASLKGKLPWPLSGTVVVDFGTQNSRGEGPVLDSHGIEIRYDRTAKVRAVADGRIVFSDFFKGYGQLMIIAHDAGYHSLYAQLAELEGAVGEQVSSGEVIAEVRNTDSSARRVLYFELRRNGRPVDPIDWLKPDTN